MSNSKTKLCQKFDKILQFENEKIPLLLRRASFSIRTYPSPFSAQPAFKHCSYFHIAPFPSPISPSSPFYVSRCLRLHFKSRGISSFRVRRYFSFCFFFFCFIIAGIFFFFVHFNVYYLNATFNLTFFTPLRSNFVIFLFL